MAMISRLRKKSKTFLYFVSRDSKIANTHFCLSGLTEETKKIKRMHTLFSPVQSSFYKVCRFDALVHGIKMNFLQLFFNFFSAI